MGIAKPDPCPWLRRPPLGVSTRFWSKVAKGDGCWVWTAAEVREMRRVFATGIGMRELARQFGRSYATVSVAVRGLTWRHVK